MNFQNLSSLWVWLAPAAANHLWQSTLFALAAGVLTLTLRKNQARTRYWLWLAVSIKFLVPFDLLVALGSSLAPARAPAGMAAGYFYATEAGQPFNQIALPATAPAAGQALSFGALLPMIVLAVWFCGFAAVLAFWFLRWRRIQAVARRAVPMDAGREVEAVRRLERANRIRKPIPLRLSAASLEPGVFGMLRPVLLWPAGVSAHLNDAHLEAILAHELLHVRYRDNLTAAMHALVQATFWFHPLVWWMGAQLVQERERGCDEDVIAMGSRPEVYAESILKACEFCVASPLASFSGVTGADLKKRIARIMTASAASKLDLRRKLLLAVAGIAAIALPLTLGRSSAAQSGTPPETGAAPSNLPVYAIVSVKPAKPGTWMEIQDTLPDGFIAHRVSLSALLREAYQINADQISGGPGWLRSDFYNLDAKVDSSDVAAFRKLSKSRRRLMLQGALAERFHLRTHWETRDLPVFVLLVAKNGPKFHQTTSEDSGRYGGIFAKGKSARGSVGYGLGFISGYAISPLSLTGPLSQLLGRSVLDETGLKGRYDLSVRWNPGDEAIHPVEGMDESSTATDASEPSIFSAFEDQLGLKLESRKAQMKVLVIDHVERPTPN